LGDQAPQTLPEVPAPGRGRVSGGRLAHDSDLNTHGWS